MGFLDEIIEQLIEELCQEIAEAAVEGALEAMYEQCANSGQESLIDSVEEDYVDQVDDIADGEFDPVDSDHPEAVGLITDLGNNICNGAAQICAALKEAAEVF